jgi:hypothetical protein
MNITVIHDACGNIEAVIASAGDAVSAHMELKPGQLVAQVEMSDLQIDADQVGVNRQLPDIQQNYRIEVEASTSRLTRKPGS